MDFFTKCHLYCTHRKKPNLIVHLDVSPEESMRRIKMRNRDCESTITLEYLQKLYSAYEAFITDIARIIPVIRVNYERFRTANEMAEMIIRYVCSQYELCHLFILVVMYAYNHCFYCLYVSYYSCIYSVCPVCMSLIWP